MSEETEKKPTDEKEPPLSPELDEIFLRRSDVLRILAPVNSETFARWQRRGLGPEQTTLPGRRIVFAKATFYEWMRTLPDLQKNPRRRRARAAAR